MREIVTEILVIGAGPAGLSSARSAAEQGANVLLVDNSHVSGGQLVKQTHKFFGAVRHGAGIRGMDLARKLTAESKREGVRFLLGTSAVGRFAAGLVLKDAQHKLVLARAQRYVIAVGASERGVAFRGWTLPGVMTAGAAQTFLNLHRVSIGDRVLVVGSGNVGLILAYHLRQAGCDVACVVEARDEIGGWAVHASKIRRLGIPVLTGVAIEGARGQGRISEVTLRSLHRRWGGTWRLNVSADAVCLAVGLSPRTQLLQQIGCDLAFSAVLGGAVPIHDRCMQTTVPGWYVAGDAAGVEEATVAMEEGQLAGLSAAHELGYGSSRSYERKKAEIRSFLDELRAGPLSGDRRAAKEKLCLSRSG